MERIACAASVPNAPLGCDILVNGGLTVVAMTVSSTLMIEIRSGIEMFNALKMFIQSLATKSL